VFNTRFSIGREVNFTIPSGAFGNGMGGLLAKMMGLPIGTFTLHLYEISKHDNK
jgi:threonine synthase